MTPSTPPATPEVSAEVLRDWLDRRARFRSRVRLAAVVAIVAAILAVASVWTIFHDHFLAMGSLQAEGYGVDWDINPANFKQGGVTRVIYSPKWYGPIQKPSLGHLRMLPRLRHLVSLDLSSLDNAHDDDFDFLAGLPELAELYLNRSPLPYVAETGRVPLTDRVLDHLQGLGRLRTLALSDNRITDAGLAKIANLKALETLDLDGTLVTDRGLDALRGLPNLKYLRVEKTAVTNKGVAEFQRAMPTVEVIRDGFSDIGANQ